MSSTGLIKHFTQLKCDVNSRCDEDFITQESIFFMKCNIRINTIPDSLVTPCSSQTEEIMTVSVQMLVLLNLLLQTVFCFKVAFISVAVNYLHKMLIHKMHTMASHRKQCIVRCIIPVVGIILCFVVQNTHCLENFFSS